MESSDFISAINKALTNQDVTRAQLEGFWRHWILVKRWNKRLNLTTISDNREAALSHYVDSLMLRPYLVAGSILDIGSGAGFPGIPLAIVTQQEVTLLEPRQKRRSFLTYAKGQLNLNNLHILKGHHTDPPHQLFSNVVTRATFSIPVDLAICTKWLLPKGRLIAMRNPPPSERASTSHTYILNGRRRILEIWQAAEETAGIDIHEAKKGLNVSE